MGLGELFKHLINVVGVIFRNESVHEWGVDACGKDGVAANLVVQKIPGHGVGHGEHGTFAGGIGKSIVDRHHAHGRRNIHDGAATTFHVGDARLQAVVDTLHVDAEHAVEIFLGSVHHIAHMRDAGIVDQAINRRIGGHGIKDRFHTGLIGYITSAGCGGTTGLGNLLDGRLAGFGVDLQNINVRALLGEYLGNSQPDARPATGDHCVFAFK